MKKHEKAIEAEQPQRVPRDLDLTPYRDEQYFPPAPEFGGQRARPSLAKEIEDAVNALTPAARSAFGTLAA